MRDASFLTAQQHNPLASLKVDSQIMDFVRRHALEAESLTEQQLAAAIRQAIECGDFSRVVCVDDGAQNVIYIPFMREQELESRIQRLESELQQHGIADPDNIEPEL